jgi:hypothetical protein
MDTTEICRLTRDALEALLAERSASKPQDRRSGKRGAPRRGTPRWPFPGTVELWIPDAAGRQWHSLATSINLSESGLGLRCDEPLEAGTELEVAIHEPEVSFHGRAVVRHCSPGPEDTYVVGLQFLFDDA